MRRSLPAEKMKWRTPAFSTPEDMQDAIEEYFESCYDVRRITTGHGRYQEITEERYQTKPFTISGLALYLGMTTECLKMYSDKGDGFFSVIHRARQVIEEQMEIKLQTPGMPTHGIIFHMKNCFKGWKDKTEQEIHQTGSMDITMADDKAKQIREQMLRELDKE